MTLKRLLKRYEKTRKKASKMFGEIMNVYEEAYIMNDVQTVQEIYNSLYNSTLTKSMERIIQNSHYGLTNYADTDSVKDNKYHVKTTNRCGKAVYHLIYKDFDKKREV